MRKADMTAKRFYLVTSGEYDSYYVNAVLSGPQSPALSTIFKRFAKEYGLRPSTWRLSTWNGIESRIREESQAVERLESEGYQPAGIDAEYSSLAFLFVAWVLKNYSDFHLMPVTEVNL